MTDAGFLDRLRVLIGRDCEHLGRHCRLVEILEGEGLVVLEQRDGLPPVQVDQFGQASHRGNEVIQIPIFGADRETFSDELMDLFNCLSARSQIQ